MDENICLISDSSVTRHSGQVTFGQEPGQELQTPPHQREAFLAAAYGSMNAKKKKKIQNLSCLICWHGGNRLEEYFSMLQQGLVLAYLATREQLFRFHSPKEVQNLGIFERFSRKITDFLLAAFLENERYYKM